MLAKKGQTTRNIYFIELLWIVKFWILISPKFALSKISSLSGLNWRARAFFYKSRKLKLDRPWIKKNVSRHFLSNEFIYLLVCDVQPIEAKKVPFLFVFEVKITAGLTQFLRNKKPDLEQVSTRVKPYSLFHNCYDTQVWFSSLNLSYELQPN